MTLQSSQLTEPKEQEIMHLIREKNISSISMISEAVDLPILTVQEIINDLASKGLLHGNVSEDGSRFFKHGLRYVSSKPETTSVDIKRNRFTPAKLTLLSGILLFVFGEIAVRLVPQNSALWDIFSTTVILSLVLIPLGLVLLSKE
jgi:hypothetical protein